MWNKKNIFENNYLLVSHYATYAMQDLIYEYLTRHKTNLVTRIDIPLPELPFLKNIKITENKRGTVVKQKNIATFIKPPAIAYLFHFLQFLFIIFFSPIRYEVIIAENSLLVLGSIFLKQLGKTKKVIYYCHGMDNIRFKNNLSNKIYRSLDTFAAKQSDLNWLLSKKMIDVRVKQGIANDTIYWVPTALHLTAMKRAKENKNNKIIFLGTINEMNGAMLLPEIISEVRKKLPEVTMDIIGDGPLYKQLQEKVKNMKLSQYVKFLGLQGFDDYRRTLTHYQCGLAPYKPSNDNLLQSTDPMKLRLYMAAGLPIITTEGFMFSNEITDNKLGFAVPYIASEFAKKIHLLFQNNRKANEIRLHALTYSLQFDQERIFGESLEKITL